jgi:hypothetical protein
MRVYRMMGVLILAALAVPAAAADESLLAPGLRVRFRTEQVAGWLEGRIVDVTEGPSEGRILRVRGRDSVVLSLPLESLTALEISTSSRRHARNGLLIGAGVGLVLGGIFWAEAESCDGCTHGDCWGPPLLTGLALSGAMYGVGIGALIQTPRWQPILLDRLRISVLPTGRRSVGVRLALRF